MLAALRFRNATATTDFLAADILKPGRRAVPAMRLVPRETERAHPRAALATRIVFCAARNGLYGWDWTCCMAQGGSKCRRALPVNYETSLLMQKLKIKIN